MHLGRNDINGKTNLCLPYSFCMVFSEQPNMSDPSAEFVQQYKKVSLLDGWLIYLLIKTFTNTSNLYLFTGE